MTTSNDLIIFDTELNIIAVILAYMILCYPETIHCLKGILQKLL